MQSCHVSFLRVCCIFLIMWGLSFSLLQTSSAALPGDHASWAVQKLKTLTLEQKIAQLMMIRVRSDYDNKTISSILSDVSKYQPGGVCFFQGSPVREIILTNRLQSACPIPMLISIDGEWGPAMRLDSCTIFPHQMTLGALAPQYDSLIYQMGFEIAKQCLALGIHIDFAPCVDINSNIDNPVINSRSFGELPDEVARKSVFLMHGMQDAGVSACIKHFPGHGNTHIDSHVDLPVIYSSRDELEKVELFPFRKNIAEGVDMVMVSHLSVPALDSRKNVMASLSYKIITDLLRNEMGYDGIIITDAMDMNGLRKYYSHDGDAEIAALLAGVDILLLPSDLNVVISAIKNAVLSGKIPEELIDERCLRVLRFKEDKGLYDLNPVSPHLACNQLNSTETQSLVNKIEEKAITLLVNNDHILPLSDADSASLLLCVGGFEDSNAYRDLANRYHLDFMQLHRSVNKKDYAALTDSIANYHTVIVYILSTNQLLKYNYGVYAETIDFLKAALVNNQVIFSLFGNPYALERFPDLSRYQSVIVGYQPTVNSAQSVMRAIYGEIGFSGHLPVSTSKFPAESGIMLPPVVNTKLEKEDFSLLPDTTNLHLDSLVQAAIDGKIIPGCQIAALHGGQMVYYKNFGNQRYDDQNPVTSETMYDLASMTKSLATTLAVMKLYEADSLELSDKIGQYLPYLKGTDKAELTLVELLTHTSGLPAFIPFYREIAVNGKMDSTYLRKEKNAQFSIEVASGVFLRNDYPDMVRTKIAHCKLNEKKYVYSDLGFILLKEMVEQITQQPIDVYLHNYFYEPLGLKNTTFNPLNTHQLEQIAPTEDDHYFRCQVVQGYVHDQSAALFGGVCGNAGLFSTAHDVSVILSMLMNDGNWNGKTYFSHKTIKMFTSVYSIHGCHRRGLGFDIPSYAKKNPVLPIQAENTTYGHQGFTGTVFWCDPENDLIYIFLSNRVFPNAEPNNLAKSKLRLLVHEEIYKGLGL